MPDFNTLPTGTPAATRCPVCGQANQCAMELEKATGLPQGPCWCTQMNFSPAVLARVPAQDQGKACICAACAQSTT